MIKAVMVINTQGKPRLTKFNEHQDSHLVYKHFSLLYIVFVFESSENELAMVDLIQVFVETLDKCFQNVCALDIVFNYDKMRTVIDEMIFGGQVMETNFAEIMRAVEQISKLRLHQVLSHLFRSPYLAGGADSGCSI